MSMLPKLKIKKHFGGGPQEEKICAFEQAQDCLGSYWPGEHWAGVLIAVDGQVIHSYEELYRLVTREDYRDKEFIEIGLYPQAGGG